MPNWCQCTLSIRVRDYDANKDNALYEKLLRTDLLQALCPTDEDDNETHWARWGTKWDIHNRFLVTEDAQRGEVHIEFETAWAPPSNALIASDARYDFELSYVEFGMCYMGETTRQDGAVCEHLLDIPDHDGDVDDEEWESTTYTRLANVARDAGATHLAEWLDDGVPRLGLI